METETYTTGAIREKDIGRGSYDLISPEGLHRLAVRYQEGAQKYADRNWEKGLPWGRTFCSMVRHAFLWLAGSQSEDHLAAVAWGAFALMHYEKYCLESCDIPSRKKTETVQGIDPTRPDAERMAVQVVEKHIFYDIIFDKEKGWTAHCECGFSIMMPNRGELQMSVEEHFAKVGKQFVRMD